MITRSFSYGLMGLMVLMCQSAFGSDPVAAYNTIPDAIGKLNYRMQNGPPGGKSVFYMKGYVYAYIPGDVECNPSEGACEGFGATNPKRHGMRPVSYTHLTLPTIYSV